jgi:mRNA interferase RelE/StbE
VASYRIEWKRSASKELQSLPRDAVRRILVAVEQLADQPMPHGTVKISGAEHSYRIRIGDYRVIYSLYESILLIEIVRVAHRRDAYR